MRQNIFEYYGSPTDNDIAQYKSVSNQLVQERNNKKRWNGFKQFFKEVFLPQGYPDSVSEDYINYQIWDTAQAFCSSITGTLATHAVLKGSGVGDETATAAGATITWLLKDGTGMVGRIAFAYFKGSSLDCNAKQWRLFADVLNDCAIFIQLMAPVLPKSYFTFVMCLAGLASSLVGVAGGCTRAALTMHQAKRNNMADVSAKDGSQETLVNLAALVTSLIITPFVSSNSALMWTLFFIFTFLHVFSNYKAVASVTMELFNRNRLTIVIKTFVDRNKILTPKEANKKESIFFPPSFHWLRFGCKLEDLNLHLREFDELAESSKYFIKNNSGVIHVALSHSCDLCDLLEAFYHAYLIHIGEDQYSGNWSDFQSKLELHGWLTYEQQLCADGWRWSTQYPVVDKHKCV